MQPHRPLSDSALAHFEEACAQVRVLPQHLFTPTHWAQAALREGLELAGTPEAASKAAECKRYLACQEALARLAERCAELEHALAVAEARSGPGSL